MKDRKDSVKQGDRNSLTIRETPSPRLSPKVKKSEKVSLPKEMNKK